ncbi:unnamed protein product [Ectocarpus sp. 6 AP-2014]
MTVQTSNERVLPLSLSARIPRLRAGVVFFLARFFLTPQQQQYFTQVCSLCNYLKPARAHHCRICNRCVLKMDHHCHWVGRCVGAGNYKAYLLTLLYACLSSGAMLVILWRRWRMGRAPESGSAAATSGGVVVGWVEMAGVAVDGLVLGFVFCSVSYLLIWHGYLVAGNVTTIEYFKWKRSMRDPGQYALSPGASIRLSEYDSGLLSNLKEAFGQRLWLWLWPGLGDGCCNRSRGASVRGEEDGGVPSKGGRWIGAARAKRLMSLFAKRRRSVGSGAGAADGGADCDPSPVCTEEEDDKLNGSAVEDGSACGRRNNGDGSSSGRRRRRQGHEVEGFGLGLEMSDVQSMIDHGGGIEPA